MQLASCRWACGSAGLNQIQTSETITELWVCYSVKNTIPRNVANIEYTMSEWPDDVTDALTAWKLDS